MKKTVLPYLLSVLSINLMLSKTLIAQQINTSEKGIYELKEYFDHLNGPDHVLLNGRQYVPLNSGNSHPYFNTEQYRNGSVFLDGENYDNVRINYDIRDQQLILQHPAGLDQELLLVLNPEMIDHFQIDGLTFRLMLLPGTGSSFFQEISSGELSCYLLWEKTLQQSTVAGNTSYRYSKQSREVYLQRKGRLYVVRNSSSFIRLFDEAYRKDIREYLRREKIRFRNASDEKLAELMNFCFGLIHGA